MKKYAGIFTAALAVAGSGCNKPAPRTELNERVVVNPHEIIVRDVIDNNRVIIHECVNYINTPSSFGGYSNTTLFRYGKNDPQAVNSVFTFNLGSGHVMKYEENSPYCKDESNKYASIFEKNKMVGSDRL